MPLLRAPENRRTGIEINPNVRYPDQTEAAIVFTPSRDEAGLVSADVARRVLRNRNPTKRTEV
jgi:hypothetical protein